MPDKIQTQIFELSDKEITLAAIALTFFGVNEIASKGPAEAFDIFKEATELALKLTDKIVDDPESVQRGENIRRMLEMYETQKEEQKVD